MFLSRVVPRLLVIAILSLVVVASNRGMKESTPSFALGRGGIPHLSHVFLIVLENREYSPAEDPPYLSSLMRRGALATHYFGIRHPSLPNYLALLSGSTHGISSDCTDCIVTGRTLVDQLESSRLSWKGYMEGMPGTCFKGAYARDYAMKHNPFIYFSSIRNNPRRCARAQPLGALNSDLRKGRTPNLAWITPNLCHDGHDCGLSNVDVFLKAWVPRILHSSAFHKGAALFITYDEGTTDAGCCRLARGGHIETLALGSGIKAGSKIGIVADHYSLLRTIEDGFRLRRLGGAGCLCTSSLASAWKR